MIEVYGRTHHGGGSLYIYEIQDNEAVRLLGGVMVVDVTLENDFTLEDSEKYDHTACGRIFKDGRLFTTYIDISGDSVYDIILNGYMDVFCKDNKADSLKVEKYFIWNKDEQKFIESDVSKTNIISKDELEKISI